ncbi:hypothetical protein M8J77_011043 [Diaphorina citri]|nr:hypothetical protein M8J77_011043 [Diaphorina citri]
MQFTDQARTKGICLVIARTGYGNEKSFPIPEVLKRTKGFVSKGSAARRLGLAARRLGSAARQLGLAASRLGSATRQLGSAARHSSKSS